MKKYKNKKSFLIIFIALFWATYTLTSILLFVADVEDIYYREKIRRQELILYQVDASLNLLVDGEIPTLKDNLTEAFKLNQFSFAILTAKAQKPFVLSRFKDSNIEAEYPVTRGMVQVGDFFYRTVKVDNYTLTVGTRIEKVSLIQAYLQSYFYKIIFDILLITILSSFLIYVALRDVIALSNLFKNSKTRDFKNIAPKSLEAQILLSATQSYQVLTDALGSQAHVFAASLGSAIVTELRRGTQAPTTFDSVLVRMDLNHYTQTYLKTDLNQMTETINTFFETARTCIERYDGLIYEYIGDEVLFLFKIKDGQQSEVFKQAFCCVRDVFTDIEALKSQGKMASNISAKASISHGLLHFVKLDQGYSFTGVPLIQSARMLSFVTEKNKNSVVIEASEKANVLEFVENFEEKSAQLKGFETEVNLLEVQNFKAIYIKSPKYYRSSVSLQKVFETIQELLQKGSLDAVMPLLGDIRTVPFGALETPLGEAFFKTLELSMNPQYDFKVLSSLVSLARNFAQNPLPDSYKSMLQKVLKHENARVRANCIITLSHFDPNLDIELTFEDKTSNRLFADILFVLGKKAMDKHLVNEISFMVNHREKLYRSSGLYICSALLRYHMEKDRVYFDSNPQFSKLKKYLKESLKDSDPDLTKHAVNFEQATGEAL